MSEECRRCRHLEEELAFAERARDNACVQREEVQARVKAHKLATGRRISEFVDLVDKLCQEVPQSTRDWARGRVAEILDRAPGAEKRVAQ